MRTSRTLVLVVLGVVATLVAASCQYEQYRYPPLSTTTTSTTASTTTTESTTTTASTTTTTTTPPPPVSSEVVLGSPYPSFGNNLGPGCSTPTSCPTDPNGNPQPNLWAAIQYPYTSHQDGDPFTTRCWGDDIADSRSPSYGRDCSDPPAFDNAKNGVSGASAPTNPVYAGAMTKWNPYYRPDGYVYAIKVESPGDVSVQIYDASCDTAGSNTQAGDSCFGSATPTDFQVYRAAANPDDVDATPGNELPDCRKTARVDEIALKNVWATICTFSAPSAGTYSLRVRNDNIPAPSPAIAGFTGCPYTDVQTFSGCRGAGYNSFAVRATGSSTQVRPVDAMSIWNGANGTSGFYLADIEPGNAGKTIHLDMYDPGDGSNGTPYVIGVKGPDAAGNSVQNFGCSWARSDAQGGTPNLSGSSAGACSIISRDTSTTPYSRFNNEWVRVSIPIPPGYTCPAGTNRCWWKVFYTLPPSATPTDRTVWAVEVV